MKIRMLSNQGAGYPKGSEHEFPDDVAARWIALGRAEAVKAAKKAVTEKESTDGD